MKTLILAAAAALIAAPALAQTAAPAPLNVEIPEIASVTADPTCGGNAGLAQQAFCVTTTQAAINDVVDSLSADFTRQGWIAAGGGDNRIVYVRRREGGGCDGFQMLAFADDSRVAAPGAPAWLAFASIPGDVCAAQPAPAPSNP
ncbi:hypothetical protein [Brevundimonas sp. FT23042]|uniref:hypothetical protein n=1 Tax=Brevundimonas sp. FT23042 TaxID=3393749 RepID=UPI003B588FAE